MTVACGSCTVDDRHEHELWLTRLRVDQERAGELVQRLVERRKEFVVVTHKTADDSLDWGGFFWALLIMVRGPFRPPAYLDADPDVLAVPCSLLWSRCWGKHSISFRL